MNKHLIIILAITLCVTAVLSSCGVKKIGDDETKPEPESSETAVETTTETTTETTAETSQETASDDTTLQMEEPQTSALQTEDAAPQVSEIKATYIDGILVVNKSYSLPSDYNPGVDPKAQSALDEMIAGAKAEGINLWIVSGFRSYEKQSTLYNNYVARDGKAEADRYSARPGYSEHQSGLAFDLNSLEQSFGETPEGKWIVENCWKYGFILRYPQDKENVTGYMYEPWHVRYLGKDTAKSVYQSGKCLEEYLGVKSVYAN